MVLWFVCFLISPIILQQTFVSNFQLKQFQKSSKGSPKHGATKSSKKNTGDQERSAHHTDAVNSDTNISQSDITHTVDTSLRDITNTTNTSQSDITDTHSDITDNTVNTHSDTRDSKHIGLEPIEPEVVTSAAVPHTDNTDTDQIVPNNQVIEETGKDTELHSGQGNRVENTDNHLIQQTGLSQVCEPFQEKLV